MEYISRNVELENMGMSLLLLDPGDMDNEMQKVADPTRSSAEVALEIFLKP